MKAIVWQGPERMELAERPEPGDARPAEVVLRPGAVGICGSEVEGYLGHMGNRVPPLVMGHEFAGEVVVAGHGAEDWLGARATVNPIAGCGHCRLCRSGQENLCPERTLIGIHHEGAFADLVRVPSANLRALPDHLDIRVGALTEPLANGVHAVGLGLAGIEVQSAVVIGAGTIGLVTLQAALLNEISHVAVVEPQDARRERARALGAHAAHADGEAARAAGEALGADLVLDAVGAQATRAMALQLVRPGGRIVCVGLAADETTLRFHEVIRGQIAILGSYAYTMGDFERREARGDVVLIGSVSGSWPDPSGPAYQAAKAGLLAFARAAGFEEHGSGVRFTTVLPGAVDTPMLDRRPEPPTPRFELASTTSNTASTPT